MKRLGIPGLMTLFLGSSLVFAGEERRIGVLIDSMCGGGVVYVEHHAVTCLLSEKCQKSGFGIFVDGKFLKFDVSGNEKAVEILEKTRKPMNVLVEVKGEFQGDTVKVSEMREVERGR